MVGAVGEIAAGQPQSGYGNFDEGIEIRGHVLAHFAGVGELAQCTVKGSKIALPDSLVEGRKVDRPRGEIYFWMPQTSVNHVQAWRRGRQGCCNIMPAHVAGGNRDLASAGKPAIEEFQMLTVELKELLANLRTAGLLFAAILSSAGGEEWSGSRPRRLAGIRVPYMMHLVEIIGEVFFRENRAITVIDNPNREHRLTQEPAAQVGSPFHEGPVAIAVRRLDDISHFNATVEVSQGVVIHFQRCSQIVFRKPGRKCGA